MAEFRTDEQVTQRLDLFAAHLGIPRRPFVEGPLWDGYALVELTRPDDLAHEVAHWMIATDEQRGQVDYGWGFDAQWIGDSDILSCRVDPQAEVDACLLGFAMLARLGYQHLPLLYETYGFCCMWNDDQPLETNTYRDRRRVQSYVEVFKAWLTGTPVA